MKPRPQTAFVTPREAREEAERKGPHMTIPSTPAKGKTLPDDLPTRYIIVSDIENKLGDYDVFQNSYLTRADADIDAQLHERVYTLLPPHLAEQWAELRKAKAQAEAALDASTIFGFEEHDVVVVGPKELNAWTEATRALAAFEQQHQIGGGT